MTTSVDHYYMTRALRLARRGLTTADPNPRVGCVLVKNDEIVGEGWHERAGEAHAEINALAQAGDDASGATAYISLEPCCHHGRTPPCSQALIDAGVARVVAAMQDPNPLVAGKGLLQCRDAGIETDSGVLEQQANELNCGFIMRMANGRPYIRIKMAMSLDGRTAMASGESQWITSEAARRDVHHLRARSSAILTGIGTVKADDPSLTVRLKDETNIEFQVPLRVVLDPDLKIDASARLLQDPGSVLIITAKGNKAARSELKPVEIIEVERNHRGLDLQQVMQLLAQREINELMVETGATLAGALLEAGLADEMVIYMAPHLMGDQARGLFNMPGLTMMKDRVQLEITDIRAVGNDWRITAKVTD
ncbi:MAG: bifunctional diaminohydroxyphosphoribosylaminopyrimidine deaminase/5-amino-6-(5-phosphoribosylamino)uracil reductase RibD [Gammaproteobacteria bacterium]|nr:MAG: bifunctional diaminohydroxyphosphoribosylaminopyrimidine deaminase/5-amino-6-(5-phosphoribosylamino)uracil reductase RibD [Gammaproteobacteria bacterium]